MKSIAQGVLKNRTVSHPSLYIKSSLNNNLQLEAAMRGREKQVHQHNAQRKKKTSEQNTLQDDMEEGVTAAEYNHFPAHS